MKEGKKKKTRIKRKVKTKIKIKNIRNNQKHCAHLADDGVAQPLCEELELAALQLLARSDHAGNHAGSLREEEIKNKQTNKKKTMRICTSACVRACVCCIYVCVCVLYVCVVCVYVCVCVCVMRMTWIMR